MAVGPPRPRRPALWASPGPVRPPRRPKRPAAPGPSAPNGTGPPPPPPPRLMGFALTNAPAPPAKAPAVARPSFSVSTDHELYAHMVWANVGGTYDAYLTFLAPNGETYEVLDV